MRSKCDEPSVPIMIGAPTMANEIACFLRCRDEDDDLATPAGHDDTAVVNAWRASLGV